LSFLVLVAPIDFLGVNEHDEKPACMSWYQVYVEMSAQVYYRQVLGLTWLWSA
jgi:hypothetical protein